ncbi:ParB/RepB/Spo0J family partition protein [Pasteurella multocida]|uniref:ParB/RepB/Spo0J family partition protein n=1 Tax=Pasteurella multocida TaxID=747 RepID=UPI000C9EC762|nr:ParB/RepB/Spo0J family partition protein [Pasteurella multocida]PNM06782.1 peptide transporter [Pasteurella multocida]WVM64516.1 ParB/RepB/Spo0J family partition protein [Pasteurella multocida]
MNDLNFGSLSSLNETSQESSKLELSLSSIIEDSEQPRIVFSEDSLNELAESIKERGVKSPISVRPHPTEPGKYIINHGARRYRASLIAGKNTIPAFIDTNYDLYDQAVENIQRENLTAREIAMLIERALKKGLSKSDIAKKLGKSNSYVSQYAGLNNLAEPVAALLNQGRCEDVTLLANLNTQFKKTPEAVEEWISQQDEFSRTGFNEFKENIGKKEVISDEEPEKNKKEKKEKIDDPDKLKKSFLKISYSGQIGRLIMNKRPSSPNRAYIKLDDSGEEVDVNLSDLSLLELIEA